MSSWIVLLGALAFGYLLGSVPFGLLLTRAAGLGDVRTIGSGNIGATNVLRTGNKGLAAATLLLDALKATAAAVIAGSFALAAAGWAQGGQSISSGLITLAHAVPVVAGAGAVLGHLFPVWLGFKGGKGIATFIGMLIGVAWPLAVVFCGIWLIVAAVSRYSSLASLVATLAVAGIAALGGHRIGLQPEIMLALKPVLAALCLLLIVKHRTNIERLLAGTEAKIGQK